MVNTYSMSNPLCLAMISGGVIGSIIGCDISSMCGCTALFDMI